MIDRETDLFFISAFDRQQRNAGKRGILQLLAKLDFLLIKSQKIMPPRVLNRRVKRSERLHENLPLNIAATRPSADLSKQLKRPFAGTKIGQVKR